MAVELGYRTPKCGSGTRVAASSPTWPVLQDCSVGSVYQGCSAVSSKCIRSVLSSSQDCTAPLFLCIGYALVFVGLFLVFLTRSYYVALAGIECCTTVPGNIMLFILWA